MSELSDIQEVMKYDPFFVDTPPLVPAPDDVGTGVCEHCGEDYEQYPGDRFCNMDCKNAFMANATKRGHAKPLEPRPCAWCDLIFTPGSAGNTMCGDKCRGEAKVFRNQEYRQRVKGE